MTATAPDVAIVGVGATDYYRRGQSWPRTINELAGEAILAACEEAGLSVKDIDGFAYYSEAGAGYGSKFDTGLFKLGENSVQDGKWTNPTEKLMPGEGAIFFNPTLDYKSHSFVGEVIQWNLSIPIPSHPGDVPKGTLRTINS